MGRKFSAVLLTLALGISGAVFAASDIREYPVLAGSHIARIDMKTGAATVIEPPTKRQADRRVWTDSKAASG